MATAPNTKIDIKAIANDSGVAVEAYDTYDSDEETLAAAHRFASGIVERLAVICETQSGAKLLDAAALRAALDVIAPRGVLVTVGLGGEIALPMNQIVAKEIDLRGTFRFHAEFATAVQFLNSGLIDGKPVITAVLPFDRAVEAFALASDKSQSLKVQIAFDETALA